MVPFFLNVWVHIFSKNLPGTGIMYHAFLSLRSPTICHILRVPGGVRHPTFVVIRQRVRAPVRSPSIVIRQRVREPGRSPCIIMRQRAREPGRSHCIIIGQRVWEPGRSPIDHPTFTSGHRLVPHLQI